MEEFLIAGYDNNLKRRRQRLKYNPPLAVYYNAASGRHREGDASPLSMPRFMHSANSIIFDRFLREKNGLSEVELRIGERVCTSRSTYDFSRSL